MKLLVGIAMAASLVLGSSAGAAAQAPEPNPSTTRSALLAAGIAPQAVQYVHPIGGVRVDLFEQPTTELLDVIFRIVWMNEPSRFDSIIVGWVGEPVVRSYHELAAVYGSRPAGLDQVSVRSLLPTGGFAFFPGSDAAEGVEAATPWLKIVTIGFAGLLVSGVLIALVRRPPSHPRLPSLHRIDPQGR